MITSQIKLIVFTGTGNTLLIAEEIKKEFEKHRFKVNLIPFEAFKMNKLDPNCTYGFGFPCAVHVTYPFIMDFLETLDYSPKTKIFFFITLGGSSSGVGTYIKRLHKKKPFNFCGYEKFQMPNNFFPEKIDNEEFSTLIHQSIKKIPNFVNNLIYNDNHAFQVDALSIAMNWVAKIDLTWRLLRKRYEFEIIKDKCINCGICESLCPVSNISYSNEEEIYFFEKHCQICGRCIFFCPQHAIKIKNNESPVLQYNGIPLDKMIIWNQKTWDTKDEKKNYHSEDLVYKIKKER